jgi:hypothetical protein
MERGGELIPFECGSAVRSVHINFRKPDGSVVGVDAKVGMSLLQVAHANDIDLEGTRLAG